MDHSETLSEKPPDAETVSPPLITEVFHSDNPKAIQDLIVDMLAINQTNFGANPIHQNRLNIQRLPELITRPDVRVVILRKPNSSVALGFSLACPINVVDEARQAEGRETAYIGFTSLMPQYQGQGFVGEMMLLMETELKALGFTHMERHAVTENGYAEKIARHYKNRIVTQKPHYSKRYRDQIFFRIRL